jgi:hypothetical protein
VEHIASGGEAPATASQFNSIKALAELAKYRKNRVRIGNSQAIPPLLRHSKYSSTNTALVLAALFVLEDLTQKGILFRFCACTSACALCACVSCVCVCVCRVCVVFVSFH